VRLEARVSYYNKPRTYPQPPPTSPRERYHNHLDPNVKKGGWSKEEDELILRLQKQYGNAWAKITSFLPGRTDNAVKNRYWSATRSAARKMKTQMNRQGSGEAAATAAAAKQQGSASNSAEFQAEKENRSSNKVARKVSKKKTVSTPTAAPVSPTLSSIPAPTFFVPPLEPVRARAKLPLPPPSIMALAQRMKRDDDMKRSGLCVGPSIAAIDYLSDEEISSSFLTGSFGDATSVVSTEGEESGDEEEEEEEEEGEGRGRTETEESEILDMTDFFFSFKDEEELTPLFDENMIIQPLY